MGISLIYLTAMNKISFRENDVVNGNNKGFRMDRRVRGGWENSGATGKNKGIENFVNAICWILFAVETKVSFALRLQNIEDDSLDFEASISIREIIYLRLCNVTEKVAI